MSATPTNTELLVPEPAFLSNDQIEQLGESISTQFKLTDFVNDNDPLHEFVKLLGGKIHYQDPAEYVLSESGSIKVYGVNNFDIFLSAFTGPLRDRFTIAHELGHYFLHSNQGKKTIAASRKGSGKLEWEANRFAAALLMPSQEFKKTAEIFVNDNSALAGHFRVSTQAVDIRLKTISSQ